MKPDYARLFPARPFYTDDLIEGVVARLRREEIPDLGSFEDIDVGEVKKWGDGRKPHDFSDARFVGVCAPGFGVDMEIPESWWERSWDDALRFVDPITRTELSIIGYENPGISYAQWAEVGLPAYRSAWPNMTRVKSAYEVPGSAWWGVAEEFRGTLPGAKAETHQLVVCLKHAQCLMLLVVAASSATFAANEKFYRSLIEWKVWTTKPRERGHRLAAEYQDIPGFARLKFWSALADPELQFQRGLLVLYGRGGKLNELGPNADPEFAVRWFLRAGNLGHPQAQFMLAILYSEGRGVAADIDEAIAWCEKSKEQGFDNAAKLLPTLEAKKRKQRSFWKFFS